jgi:Domain of unknown function (DUF4157)
LGSISMLYGKTPEVKKRNSPLRIQRTKSSQPIKTPADRILLLQRTIGNQAVQQLIKSGTLQAKLRIGQPGDKYEQEADRVADAVMRMPERGVQRQVEPEEEEEETLQSKPLAHQITPLVQVQRQEGPEEEEETLQAKPLAEEITPLVQKQVEPEEEEEELQAKATSGRISEVNSNLESHILSLKGSGQPLRESARAYFEPRFGRDFSQVRVHTDAQAEETAQAVNARAFTVGRDVMFGKRQYAPGASQGQKLMAHELTHVVQQGVGAGRRIIRREQEESEKKSGKAGGVQSKASIAKADPCGGKSKAKSYIHTDKGIKVSLGSKAFGNTSKLAAYFGFGACKIKNNWHFHLTKLTVKIASKVQSVGFKTNVKTANDKVVTSSTYQEIINDLRPNRSVRFRLNCSGNRFTDRVSSYSRRRKYWKRQLVVEHEAFHRRDWNKMYRNELIQAEKEIWGHSIPASATPNAQDAIKKAQNTLTNFMISAYQRTCKSYTPQQETRAYDAGKAKYQKLVDDILKRAKREKWQ